MSENENKKDAKASVEKEDDISKVESSDDSAMEIVKKVTNKLQKEKDKSGKKKDVFDIDPAKEKELFGGYDGYFITGKNHFREIISVCSQNEKPQLVGIRFTKKGIQSNFFAADASSMVYANIPLTNLLRFEIVKNEGKHIYFRADRFDSVWNKKGGIEGEIIALGFILSEVEGASKVDILSFKQRKGKSLKPSVIDISLELAKVCTDSKLIWKNEEGYDIDGRYILFGDELFEFPLLPDADTAVMVVGDGVADVVQDGKISNFKTTIELEEKPVVLGDLDPKRKIFEEGNVYEKGKKNIYQFDKEFLKSFLSRKKSVLDGIADEHKTALRKSFYGESPVTIATYLGRNDRMKFAYTSVVSSFGGEEEDSSDFAEEDDDIIGEWNENDAENIEAMEDFVE